MGVHDLWSILGPVRESVPLYSLTGKTLAVDLSIWVCEAQQVQGMMGKVTKPHLRNLFFRVSSLLLMGVKLVFVMEGEAPKLKAQTMNKRTQMRFGGSKKAAPKTVTTKSTNRGRFNAVLRECAEMLDSLGVPWVTAAGEAEAMCAFLDSQGLVDGCITNDGDAFLYGAQTVYRNFNMNTKDPQVDCYRTPRVQTELHLARETLVGLAILLGCDYIPKGIPGVGREQTLKLIHTLKGQTLLQRFSQWKAEGVGVSEGVIKKVTHCLVCRHPGSAKTHERSGCVLCDSKSFCEPQDYDYQCPCDWHCYEQTHKATSAEASIRKKTLSSDKFPFTEIINEFLVDKDKPVQNFKRRKPNMLLMQNFMYAKMEWPKHYTSEKVLILMTYTELMNRKHGRETSSQIKPLRIWKPRVRNSIACFEVIWSKPEYYMFPEDHPVENQDEVRTVEEEALFRLAYPEVVDMFLKEKAEAEENKTKKKKPKSKKDKLSDDPFDGVSDLLAQMSLHSSTADSNTQQPSAREPAPTITITNTVIPAPTITNTVIPEVTPKPPGISKQSLVSDEDPPCLGAHLGAQIQAVVSSPPPDSSSWKIPETASASPSASMVIDQLHLSDIDWEALSFTSSPPPQVASTRFTDHESVETLDGLDVKEKEKETDTMQGSLTDLRPAEARPSVPESCYSECSLRDRVLMRNALKSMNPTQAHCDDVTAHVPVNTQAAHSNNQGPKPAVLQLIPLEGSSDSKSSEQPQMYGKKAPLIDMGQRVTSELNTCHSSKAVSISSTQTRNAKEHVVGGPKPPQKYKFVKTAISSSSAPPQRSHSEPGPGGPVGDDRNRKLHQTVKKSVCASVCSSSEDSDAENRRQGVQKKTKIKPKCRPRCHYLTEYPLKPTSKPTTTKATSDTTQPLRPRAISAGEQIQGSSVSSKGKYQVVPTITVDDNVLIPSPVSPVTVSDSDDSVVCSESPLPLAERLRLKFLNN